MRERHSGPWVRCGRRERHVWRRRGDRHGRSSGLAAVSAHPIVCACSVLDDDVSPLCAVGKTD